MIPQAVFVSLHTLEIAGLVYLGLGLAKLSQRISRIEGKNEERERGAR